MQRRFEGIIPPVTTPFSPDGDLQLDLLERNVERYLATELSGLLLLGSNGEAVHLSDQERLQMIRHVAPLVAGQKLFLVGLSAMTLREALATTDALSDLPIDALLVSVPAYYRNRMTTAVLVDYFTQVAENAPFPVLLYNVPQYSGLEISPEVVRNLAPHPNIPGMKDSSGNLHYVQHVLAATAEVDFEVIMGSAQVLAPALLLGIRAAILAVACAMPSLPIQLFRDYEAGRDIRQQQARLFQVANAVTSIYGVPGLKAAMNLNGFEGGSCRAPLADLSESEVDHLRQLLGISKRQILSI